MHKGYKCLDRDSGRIFISRDVVFDEGVFPFAQPSPTVPNTTIPTTTTFPSDEPVVHDSPVRRYDLTLLQTSDNASSVSSPDAGSAVNEDDGISFVTPPSPSAAAPDACSADNKDDGSSFVAPPTVDPATNEAPAAARPAAVVPELHTMTTRLRNNITKPRVRTDGTILYNPNHKTFFATPRTHRDALTDTCWREAMEAEFSTLQQNKT